ncbi:DUF1289 domain-containing protein [Halomonas sp. EGI 63088]|uniref:DUF1289 domain-containing protein n=1 Tax=Halomonas flagellata TaxID=2920385 RepID=A0ABS9RUZ9_9GAMM|nr:DUF1289 domain-containing protein [Halomonas flagellata]MCH4563681.1 DUF1289 domain-containing protein [Halomonas flagellata]
MGATITSPCVGLCSTTLGDRVCRGCQRGDDEICDWFGLSAAERAERMAELDALREAVAGRFLRLVDAECLEAQLERHRIRVRPEQPPLSRAVELLRVGRERIRDLARYGLAPRAAFADLEASELHARLSLALADAAEQRRAGLSRTP